MTDCARAPAGDQVTRRCAKSQARALDSLTSEPQDDGSRKLSLLVDGAETAEIRAARADAFRPTVRDVLIRTSRAAPEVSEWRLVLKAGAIWARLQSLQRRFGATLDR
jgi:hypothetical protein